MISVCFSLLVMDANKVIRYAKVLKILCPNWRAWLLCHETTLSYLEEYGSSWPFTILYLVLGNGGPQKSLV